MGKAKKVKVPKKRSNPFVGFIKFIFILALIGALGAAAINFYMIYSVDKDIKKITEIDSLPKTDCALVLGAFVVEKSLSAILRDRVETGIKLYKAGKVGKILLSGDHGTAEYDEVNAMMDYCLKAGVPKEDIFLDHAGFSTYESIYRARDVFKCKTITIATQRFHLSRAMFISQQLGVKAYAVDSTINGDYYVSDSNSPREILARVKDFFTAMFLKPKPTYLGDAIPITGSGVFTQDK